jgi:hypothetical protein
MVDVGVIAEAGRRAWKGIFLLVPRLRLNAVKLSVFTPLF